MTLPLLADGPALTVIDTQAVLDWLYFNDPVCAGWEAARQAGRWHAQAAPAMRAELAHVLARRHLPGWSEARAAQVLADFDARIHLLPEPPAPPLPRPMCKDRDDQKFIDLALALNARWLVSRDRAVMKLGKRLANMTGLQVLTPAQWQP